MSRCLKFKLLTILVGTILLGNAMGQQPEDQKHTRKVEHSLIPVLSRAMDSPRFVIDYRNDGDTVQDLTQLILNSSIVLDKVEYNSNGVRHTGTTNLLPGRSNKFKISLSSYLPREGYERKGYSKKLKRWRWKTPLNPGRHTLSVKMGTKQYGPIVFEWDPSAPLLYE